MGMGRIAAIATLMLPLALCSQLRYRCEEVKVKGDICDTYLVAGCVPAAMLKETYTQALEQDVTRESCRRISEYTCWKLEKKDINPEFCQGSDPGFCMANRAAMRSSCSKDDECNPYNPPKADVHGADVCCDVWKAMQPCVMSDAEIEFAVQSQQCSNATTCVNPITPANDGDSILHKVHCFFTTYLNFFFRQPCE